MNIETVNEIEKLAEQHGMTVEFVTWFFNEKKSACGEHWFLALGAMWEGWKGRSAESTASLATIEKFREITNCPAGVGLQDHLRKLVAERDVLAAENVGLKSYIYDECYVTPPNSSLLAEADIPAGDFMPETTATDAYLAGIKADGVDCVAHKFRVRAQNSLPVAGWIDAARAAEDFAKQLREGAK